PKQATLQGTQDAFVTRFSPSGTALVYSTFLGGNSTDTGRAIAADSTGNAYVTGETNSTNFPTTPGALQTNGSATQFIPDAFVTKIDATGQTFSYSTYLGGIERDAGNAIAVDSVGNAFVTGYTASSNFPIVSAIQPNFGGGSFTGDAFVTKLNSSGSGAIYSTYLGGSGDDRAQGIAVDGTGNAYVTGATASNNFPIVAGAFKTLSPIFKSANGGSSWNNNNGGVPPARDLVMNPNSLTLYAATTRGVYRSSDNGNTWSATNNGLTNLQTEVLALDKQNPSTMYVGNGDVGVIFKSTDAGNTWSPANGNQNFPAVTAIETDPVTPNTVYLSSR
ncbi:MAG TPA: SBBP repeat-containing protein, partial [Pyrinomonadaceae bacterium]